MQNLVEKPLGKLQLERLRMTLQDNSKMDLKEIICEQVRWTKLSQDRVQWQKLEYRTCDLIEGRIRSFCLSFDISIPTGSSKMWFENSSGFHLDIFSNHI